jgi:hypothetical protein
MNHTLAFSIVRSLTVTGPAEERLRRLRGFSDRDWRRTLPWLDDSGLALELLNVLDRAGAPDVLPAAVERELSVRLAHNRQRLAEMKREFESINRAFEGAGVDYAVLKGFSLVPAYTPDPSLRSQHDYDYLVHPRSLETAKQVLETAGLNEKEQRPGLDPPDTIEFNGEPWDCSASGEEWYSARIPRRVELHLSLWQYDRDAIRIRVPKDVLKRKRPACWDGLRFPVLADDDALLFQCLHAFHHILDYWCRPSCFLEIARFMADRAQDQEFWGRFRASVEGAGDLPEISRLVFRLASELFRAPVPEGFGLAAMSPRSQTLDLWVRRYGIEWCLARYPGSKLTLLLHREFVHEPAVWRSIRRDRLLPFHRPVRAADSSEPNSKSRWKARRQQWRFALGRVRHHVVGLVTYAWHGLAWSRALRRDLLGAQGYVSSAVRTRHSAEGSRKACCAIPAEADYSPLPAADCLLPTGKGPAQ